MQLGVVSDIHANKVALDAVLEDMPDVDRLVCAGDVVGYNPWPAACVDWARENDVPTVQGNHDRNVETPDRYSANHMAHRGLQHAKAELEDAEREWLANLPRKRELADGRVLMVHDHPEHVDRYVRPHQFPQLRPHLEDYDACILGHTHVQHAATVDGRLILNPGSVGQPRDEDPRAAYAVIDTDSEPMTADLHRVAYDIEQVQAAIRDVGLPERTAARLAAGR